MHTQILETAPMPRPQLFNTLNTPYGDSEIDLSDLQQGYRAHQKALLKELHIKDKTHALRDPSTYFALLTWQVVERCFDRIVWSEPRPTHGGKGYSTSAHCAVFRTNDVGTMIPTFWARVSYRTQTDTEGTVRFDHRGNPALEPDAHTVDTDLQGLKRHDDIYYRFCQSEQRGLQVHKTQHMVGRAVLLDELDSMRHLDTFGGDVLAVVHGLDQMTDEQRAHEDHLARVATRQMLYGPTL